MRGTLLTITLAVASLAIENIAKADPIGVSEVIELLDADKWTEAVDLVRTKSGSHQAARGSLPNDLLLNDGSGPPHAKRDVSLSSLVNCIDGWKVYLAERQRCLSPSSPSEQANCLDLAQSQVTHVIGERQQWCGFSYPRYVRAYAEDAATITRLRKDAADVAAREAPKERAGGKKTFEEARKKIRSNKHLAKVLGRVERAFIDGCRLQEQRWIAVDRAQSTSGREQVRAAYEAHRIGAAIEISKRRNGALIGWAFEQLGSTGAWSSTEASTGETTESADDPDRDQLTDYLHIVEECFCPTEEALGPCTSVKQPHHAQPSE